MNGDFQSIRRSTRQRKLLYGTFNQNLIDKHLAIMQDADSLEEEEEAKPSRKRRRIEVEPLSRAEVAPVFIKQISLFVLCLAKKFHFVS